MGWVRIMVQARSKPTPFDVVVFNQDMMGSWGSFLQKKYLRKYSFLTRPIRGVIITKEHPHLIHIVICVMELGFHRWRELHCDFESSNLKNTHVLLTEAKHKLF
ncbi:hypothetical protein ANN_17962 [Periplaneta americana]|uniref:Uncharacterized protein n=1 Tax=Periplaneta americana TaxID=6978 RepID=A0ABQ8SNE4_PERAM|nr:hypothetical protein ANN_17962 [Periplaneta americana]